MLDHRVLHRGVQVLGLLQLQTHGVRRRRLPGQGEHLAHHCLGVLIGVQHDLHGDLHAALAPVADSAARARFSVRRSNRSTPRSGSRPPSSSRCSPNRVRSSVFQEHAQDLGHPEGRGQNVMGLGVFEEGLYPAAALRRASPAPAGAARVDPAGIHDQDLLQTQVQAPAVGEVVVVDEPFGRP